MVGEVMVDVIEGIPELIEAGEKFTFDNFSSKSPRKFPSADWLVSTHQVNRLLARMDTSPIKEQITSGLGLVLLGYPDEEFQKSKNLILNGLRAAQKVFGTPIPASDRTVFLGHYSSEQMQALEKIDELVEAVCQDCGHKGADVEPDFDWDKN